MPNYKFTPNKWIIFDYLFGTAIGITSIKERQNIITFVADNGAMGEMPFASIERPRALCIQSSEPHSLTQFLASFPNSVVSNHKGEA